MIFLLLVVLLLNLLGKSQCFTCTPPSLTRRSSITLNIYNRHIITSSFRIINNSTSPRRRRHPRCHHKLGNINIRFTALQMSLSPNENQKERINNKQKHTHTPKQQTDQKEQPHEQPTPAPTKTPTPDSHEQDFESFSNKYTSIIINSLSILGLSSAFILFWSEISILLTKCSPAMLSISLERSAYISSFLFAAGTNLSKIIYGCSMTELLLLDDLQGYDPKDARMLLLLGQKNNTTSETICNCSDLHNHNHDHHNHHGHDQKKQFVIRPIERGLFYATEVVAFMAVVFAFAIVLWQFNQGIYITENDTRWCQVLYKQPL